MHNNETFVADIHTLLSDNRLKLFEYDEERFFHWRSQVSEQRDKTWPFQLQCCMVTPSTAYEILVTCTSEDKENYEIVLSVVDDYANKMQMGTGCKHQSLSLPFKQMLNACC